MSKRHKNIYHIYQSQTERLLVLASAVTGYVYISDFTYFTEMAVGIANSPVTIKIFVIFAGIKKNSLIIQKRT